MMDVAFAFQCNIWWKFTKITPTAELMEYLLSFSEVSLSHERQWLSKKNLFLSREIKEIRGAYAYECSCWPAAWSGTKFSRLCPRSVPVDEETVPPSWTLSNAMEWRDLVWRHCVVTTQSHNCSGSTSSSHLLSVHHSIFYCTHTKYLLFEESVRKCVLTPWIFSLSETTIRQRTTPFYDGRKSKTIANN